MDVQAQRRPILPGARRGSRKKVSSASRSLISLEYRYDPSADDDVLKTEVYRQYVDVNLSRCPYRCRRSSGSGWSECATAYRSDFRFGATFPRTEHSPRSPVFD